MIVLLVNQLAFRNSRATPTPLESTKFQLLSTKHKVIQIISFIFKSHFASTARCLGKNQFELNFIPQFMAFHSIFEIRIEIIRFNLSLNSDTFQTKFK